jgi:hypothetical protein
VLLGHKKLDTTALYTRAAIRAGYSVLFTTAPGLVAALARAHADGRGATSPPPAQDSLPAGGLRLYWEESNPLDRFERFQVTSIRPSRTSPVARVLYTKRPFGGPDAVLAYLSRYTHRIAIANSRLVALDGARVTFKWKDYRAKADARYKPMTLDVDEFIRRFLIHVLPNGFHRIRHYGFFGQRQSDQQHRIGPPAPWHAQRSLVEQRERWHRRRARRRSAEPLPLLRRAHDHRRHL